MRGLSLLVLAACGGAKPPPVETHAECPGEYTIARGKCEIPVPTDCKGVCGYVLRRGNCEPVKNASISAIAPTSPGASTDENGRFDLVGLAPGHYDLRVFAERDDGRLALDVVEGAQPLAFPLELTFLDRTCSCGGVCPT